MALPELLFRACDFKEYIEQVYQIFLETITRAELTFNGLPIRTQFLPSDEGKHATFWHLITEGIIEIERTPDERRCERIRWVAWLIINATTETDVTWWENTRKGNAHVVIYIENQEFAVILAKRNKYYLLKSAYCVKEHRRNDFRRERDEYLSRG
jgi:hypothetical protein